METKQKAIPETVQREKPMQEATATSKQLPDTEVGEKGQPVIGNAENTVRIGDQQIEIKPTKLLYQRNRTAVFYRMLDMYPLPDILAMESGQFGDDRDGDKAVMDWLIAVTDDPKLIKAHYNDIDTETVEKLLLIFKRLNRITEKEEKIKNMEKARKAVE